jgi:hypothetical protein
MKRKWSSVIKTIVHECWIEPIKGHVFFTFTWREPTRRRDPHNVAGGAKIIFDALQQQGIIEGDGWKVLGPPGGWVDRFEIDKENPGVLVEMERRNHD